MLTALVLAAVLANAAPEAQADAPKPAPAAAKAKAPKPGQVCTSKVVGKIAGHEVTHVKCEDAKPAAEPPPPAAPSTPG